MRLQTTSVLKGSQLALSASAAYYQPAAKLSTETVRLVCDVESWFAVLPLNETVSTANGALLAAKEVEFIDIPKGYQLGVVAGGAGIAYINPAKKTLDYVQS